MTHDGVRLSAVCASQLLRFPRMSKGVDLPLLGACLLGSSAWDHRRITSTGTGRICQLLLDYLALYETRRTSRFRSRFPCLWSSCWQSIAADRMFFRLALAALHLPAHHPCLRGRQTWPPGRFHRRLHDARSSIRHSPSIPRPRGCSTAHHLFHPTAANERHHNRC